MSRRSAFTLIELLTVIAIIGILAAIIIPVVGSVRKKAKEAQGISNIRQIVMGTLAFAQDNRDMLPWGFDSGNNSAFSTEISGYLNKGTGKYNDAASRSSLFLDPVAGVDGGNCHYSGNQALLPNKADEAVHPRYKLVRSATRFNELVLVADGSQNNVTGDANATLNRLHALGVSRRAPYDPNRADHETTLRANMGTNLDDGVAGWIRWRMGAEKAKFGFLDGHVSVLGPDEIRNRNFRPN